MRAAATGLGIVLLLTGCVSHPLAELPSTPKPTITETSQPISSPEPVSDNAAQLNSPTSIAVQDQPSNILIETERELVIAPHSPLDQIPIAELADIISNPFLMPDTGKDDGHHGVDFAFYQFNDFDSIEGHPVVPVFPGIVSGVVNDRPPYGNLILIETNLGSLPESLQSRFSGLLPDGQSLNQPQLTCPALPDASKIFPVDKYSLYTLYAHLQSPVSFRIGEIIPEDTEIGRVGNSGMSGNPHLHLEFRLGPADYQFPAMSHYENSATDLEMTGYCIWRVSGWFVLIDPLSILLIDMPSSAN